jgi:hypothetical protein
MGNPASRVRGRSWLKKARGLHHRQLTGNTGRLPFIAAQGPHLNAFFTPIDNHNGE